MVAIISATLLRITENGVGLGNLHEAIACLRVVRMSVWVGLFGKGVEMFLQLCFGAVRRHS